VTLTVAIVGLGAMGSMTAWQLAARGHRVVGFDRFRPPHQSGSSGGLSRIIREAYYEQPYYVPLVRRAYDLWDDLAALARRPLLTVTGGLMIGASDSAVAGGARRSAEEHGIPFALLTPAAVRERFPAFRLPADQVALLDRRAGVLAPEAAIDAALGLAAAAGAELRVDEAVLGWEAGSRIRVRTATGWLEADRLVLAAGAWMTTALPRLDVPLTATRQVLFWFAPARNPDWFAPDRFPVFLWQWTRGHSIYGFPDQGEGVKVAIHHEGPGVDPDAADRAVRPGEEDELRAILAQCLPEAAGPVRRSAVCLYTTTRDEDFILDRHPADPRVLVASPCSGHGFKFAPAVGEALADLATDRAPRVDLARFAIGRAGLRGPALRTEAHG
jgi:sarcosine oxidase